MTITFLRNHDRPFDKVFREKQLREVLKQGQGTPYRNYDFGSICNGFQGQVVRANSLEGDHARDLV